HPAVEEHVRTVGLVEAEVPAGPERRILAPDPVQPGDVVFDIAGLVPVAHADLVLLRVQVLFGPGHWRGLAQLKAAVYAPEWRERRGQSGPHLEGGGPAALQDLRQDVRGVAEEIAAEILGHLRTRQLLEILGQLFFEVAPREVRVRLAES